MTDRELLEFAAKAAGPDIFGEPGLWFRRLAGSHVTGWNPLTDDGDAFRLVVKLGLSLGPSFDGELAVCFARQGADITEEYGSDPTAATRRSIVRAAAAIGKAFP